MATTRGWGLKGNINNAIDYILDFKNKEKKTNNGKNIYTNVDGESPYTVGSLFRKEAIAKKTQDKNVGYHFQFSLPPNEGTESDCLELAKEWIESISQGKAKYVIAVHSDKKSIHAHIIVDRYLKDGRAWDIYWKKAKHIFRKEADRICKEHGFSTLKENSNISRNYYNWMKDQNKTDSNRILLKKVLNEIIPKVSNYNDLKSYLNQIGFTVLDDKKSTNDNNFCFTVNTKLIREMPDGNYRIRIPYQYNYIEVKKEYFKWIKKGVTAQINIPIDEKVKEFSNQSQYLRNAAAIDLKKSFDEKNKTNHGRKGLRIKIQGSKRTIRTKYLDEDIDYSLEGIQKQIESNGVTVTDKTIKNVIDGNLNYAEIKKVKSQLFEDAGVHLNFEYKNSTVYKSIAQENFYNWKSRMMHDKLDKLNYSNLVKDDRNNIEVLIGRKKEILNEIKDCNKALEQFEKELEELTKNRIENIINVKDETIDKYIIQNKSPLLERKAELKEMLSLYDDRIKHAQEYKQNKQKEQIR